MRQCSSGFTGRLSHVQLIRFPLTHFSYPIFDHISLCQKIHPCYRLYAYCQKSGGDALANDENILNSDGY